MEMPKLKHLLKDSRPLLLRPEHVCRGLLKPWTALDQGRRLVSHIILQLCDCVHYTAAGSDGEMGRTR